MNQPSNEARIANLEQLTLNLGARIEESAGDTAEELKAIRQDIKQGHMDIGKALDSHAEALMQEIRKIEATQEQQRQMLKEHGHMLKEILDRLPPKQ